MKRWLMPDVVIIALKQRGFLEEGNPLYCGDETHNPRLKKAHLAPHTRV